jgi:hypothetical protein
VGDTEAGGELPSDSPLNPTWESAGAEVGAEGSSTVATNTRSSTGVGARARVSHVLIQATPPSTFELVVMDMDPDDVAAHSLGEFLRETRLLRPGRDAEGRRVPRADVQLGEEKRRPPAQGDCRSLSAHSSLPFPITADVIRQLSILMTCPWTAQHGFTCLQSLFIINYLLFAALFVISLISIHAWHITQASHCR